MLISIFMSLLLVTACIHIHFSALRHMGALLHLSGKEVRYPLLRVLFALFTLHLIEVMLYAAGMLVLEWLGNGHMQGASTDDAGLIFDSFYFSMASYTTLGIGDIVPHGPIRIVAAIEALNGLILITWSASFTYLMMERYWKGDIGGAEGNG